MNTGRAPHPRKSSPVAVLLIVGITFALIAVLSIGVFLLVRPRGEAIGKVSLTDALASIAFDAKGGESLSFRVDASIAVPLVSVQDDDQRDREASEHLRKSQLVVRATSPAGLERVTTCAIYKGRATSTSRTPGTFSRTGMLNDCVVAVDAPGRWTLRGSVVWAAPVTVRSATLEARRESSKH